MLEVTPRDDVKRRMNVAALEKEEVVLSAPLSGLLSAFAREEEAPSIEAADLAIVHALVKELVALSWPVSGFVVVFATLLPIHREERRERFIVHVLERLLATFRAPERGFPGVLERLLTTFRALGRDFPSVLPMLLAIPTGLTNGLMKDQIIAGAAPCAPLPDIDKGCGASR